MSNFSTLCIIGNGFDIHHGIASAYAKFRDWLKHNDKFAYRLLNDLYGRPDNVWWSDFENNLANVDEDGYPKRLAKLDYWGVRDRLETYYKKDGLDFIDGLEDSGVDCYNNHKLLPEVASFEMSKFKEVLTSNFSKWITSLKYPPNISELRIVLPENAFFINFNYTNTLEDIYGIDEDSVAHLHGYIGQSKYDEFIIGHGMTASEMSERNLEENAWKNKDPMKDDNGAGDVIIELFDVIESELKKHVDEVIHKFRSDFDALRGIMNVETYGFSFSPIDLPYLDEVIKVAGNDISFKVGCHTNKDKIRAKEYFLRNGIEKYNLVEF